MFEISHNELPVVRTRQALIVLDAQNDVVSVLNVNQPANFIENTVQLSKAFRTFGDVIWIASVFEASRKINDARGEGEVIVTDAQIEQLGRRKSSDGKRTRPRPRLSSSILAKYQHLLAQSMLDDEESQEGTSASKTEKASDLEHIEDENDALSDDSEAFLTVKFGRQPRFVLTTTQGYNFTQPIISSIDSKRDMVLWKTHYSAFKTGNLLETLRGKMVTELFICGALTNIGVFATALDAARHGYTITIVDDCCGYRNKSRHDEAIRQIVEATGCNVSSSLQVIEDLKSIGQAAKKTPVGGGEQPPDVQTLLKSLSLQQESSRAAIAQTRDMRQKSKQQSSSGGARKRSDSSALQEPSSPGEETRRVRSKVKTRRRTSQPLTVNENEAIGTQDDRKAHGKGKYIPSLEKASSAPALIQGPSSPDIGADKFTNPSSRPARGDSEEIIQPEIDDDPIVAESPPDPTPICEGDTSVVPNLLEPSIADEIFTRIKYEVKWQRMLHQGGEVPRLVAVQGEVSKDGSIPVYRHPSDESPPLTRFSPTVKLVRAQVEKSLGHPVNHVLIQFYRSGTDYISEHSDKTLDIAPNTLIANVSFGAQRTMIFRTKKSAPDATPGAPRRIEKAALPHNSLCKVGLKTNMHWLHAIKQDKRPARERSENELAYDGERISLTFRLIGTFLNRDETKIWGQGATSKEKEDAKSVINGETAESQKMLYAFSTENKSSDFDWEGEYGGGFDVLHMSNSRKLYLSGDPTIDLRVQFMLSELDISWTLGSMPYSFSSPNDSTRSIAVLRFVDNDPNRTVTGHDSAILLYLDAFYNQQNRPAQPRSDAARQYTRFSEAIRLLDLWRDPDRYNANIPLELKKWAGFARENVYIAGETVGIADFAVLPVFKEIVSLYGIEVLGQDLRTYYEKMTQRKAIAKILTVD